MVENNTKIMGSYQIDLIEVEDLYKKYLKNVLNRKSEHKMEDTIQEPQLRLWSRISHGWDYLYSVLILQESNKKQVFFPYNLEYDIGRDLDTVTFRCGVYVNSNNFYDYLEELRAKNEKLIAKGELTEEQLARHLKNFIKYDFCQTIGRNTDNCIIASLKAEGFDWKNLCHMIKYQSLPQKDLKIIKEKLDVKINLRKIEKTSPEVKETETKQRKFW